MPGARISVSSHGRLFNNDTEKLLKTPANHGGYLRTCVTYPGKGHKSEYVHTLVANAFLGVHHPERSTVDHIDRNKLNNRDYNLRWVTKRQSAVNTSGKGYIKHGKSRGYMAYFNKLDWKTGAWKRHNKYFIEEKDAKEYAEKGREQYAREVFAYEDARLGP